MSLALEPPAKPAHSPFAAFQFADFRLHIASRFLMTAALEMLIFAVAKQVYDATHRPIDLGYIGLARFLPVVTLSLVTGSVADRFDRRRIVLLCDVVFVVCAGFLYLLARTPGLTIFFIFATLALLSTSSAFLRPASSGLLPSIVPRDHFGNAASWQSTAWQIAVITGPTVGAIIYEAGKSPGPVYLTSACGLFVATILVSGIRTRTLGLDRRPPTLATALAGLRYVWSRKILLGCTVLDFFAVFFGGAVALFPVFAVDVLHVGTTALGTMRSAQALGASTMAAFLAFRPIRRHAGLRLLLCIGIFGAATIVFGLSKNYLLSIVAIAILGAADMVSVVVRMHLEQAATPPEMRGRVSAVNMVFIGGSNELGDLESGIAAQFLGPVAAVVAGGVGTIAVVAAAFWIFKDIRRIDKLEDVTPTA